MRFGSVSGANPVPVGKYPATSMRRSALPLMETQMYPSFDSGARTALGTVMPSVKLRLAELGGGVLMDAQG